MLSRQIKQSIPTHKKSRAERLSEVFNNKNIYIDASELETCLSSCPSFSDLLFDNFMENFIIEVYPEMPVDINIDIAEYNFVKTCTLNLIKKIANRCLIWKTYTPITGDGYIDDKYNYESIKQKISTDPYFDSLLVQYYKKFTQNSDIFSRNRVKLIACFGALYFFKSEDENESARRVTKKTKGEYSALFEYIINKIASKHIVYDIFKKEHLIEYVVIHLFDGIDNLDTYFMGLMSQFHVLGYTYEISRNRSEVNVIYEENILNRENEDLHFWNLYMIEDPIIKALRTTVNDNFSAFDRFVGYNSRLREYFLVQIVSGYTSNKEMSLYTTEADKLKEEQLYKEFTELLSEHSRNFYETQILKKTEIPKYDRFVTLLIDLRVLLYTKLTRIDYSLKDVKTVFNREINYIETDILNPIITKYGSIATIDNINRAVVGDMLKDRYECYESQMAMLICLNVLFEKISHPKRKIDSRFLTKDVNNFLTNITKLSEVGASVEGFVYMAGFKYLAPSIIMKSPIDPSDALYHEYYVGMKLNQLREQIPNFMFVYGMFKCPVLPDYPKGTRAEICKSIGDATFLLGEKVDGESFIDYITDGIKSNQFNAKEFFTILAQVLLALQIAFDKFKYCHRDLHLGNIMVRKRLPEKKYIKYSIESRKTEKYVLTDLCATIIDYGWSCIGGEYENEMFAAQSAGSLKALDYIPQTGQDINKICAFIIHNLGTKSKQYGNQEAMSVSSLFTNYFTQRGYTVPDPNSRRYSPNWGYIVDQQLKDNDKDFELLNLRPYDFLMDMMKVIPVYMRPDVFDEAPKNHKQLGGSGKSSSCDIKKLDSMVKNIYPKDKVSTNVCDEESWKKLEQSKITGNDGTFTTWYECGDADFDGNFNVVKFPKGMSLYSGNPMLPYNNEVVDLSSEYFDRNKRWITDEEISSIIKDANVKPESRLSKIKEKSPDAIIYLTDYQVALNDSKNSLCGSNCISAFVLKEDCVFVNMIDDENSLKVMFENKGKFIDIDAILETIFKIAGTKDINKLVEILETGNDRVKSQIIDELENFRSILSKGVDPIKPEHAMCKEIVKYIINMNKGYVGFLDPYNRFVMGKNIMDFVERDFTNTHDWQYMDNKRLDKSINDVIDNMMKYTTTNINVEQGNLYEHSIWTSLYIRDQFNKGTRWAIDIPIIYKNAMVIAGMFHDIGIMGDVVFSYHNKEHGEKGYRYIKGDELLKLKLGRGVTNVDLTNFLDNFYPEMLIISNKPLYEQTKKIINDIIIPYIILVHDELESFIKLIDDSLSNTKDVARKYVEHVDNLMKTKGDSQSYNDYKSLDKNKKMALYSMIMLVSACSIMASKAYNDKNNVKTKASFYAKKPNFIDRDFNDYSREFDFIRNRPKVNPGSDKAKDLDIERKGIALKKEVIKHLTDIL